jgi:hypothetical protein
MSIPAVTRKVTESPIGQGADEEVYYRFAFANWGTPSSPTVVIKDSDGTDQSSTCLTGSPVVATTYVTTPKVHSLTAGEVYRLECKATISGSVLEAWCEIQGEV